MLKNGQTDQYALKHCSIAQVNYENPCPLSKLCSFCI